MRSLFINNLKQYLKKKNYMDKAFIEYSNASLFTIDVKKYIFRPQDDNEELLGSEVPYLSAIGALIDFANNTRPDTFSVNLLVRYNSSPKKKTFE